MITLSNRMLASVNVFETGSKEELTVTLTDVEVHQEAEFDHGLGYRPAKVTITGTLDQIFKKGEKHESEGSTSWPVL